jgi:alanine-glyoxylate transaminase/serine-glyoxylate transaminase/serine-pyruvate transaminase
MTIPPIDPTKLEPLAIPQRLLLGPGPSLVDPRVLQVMATPLIGHLDPAFLQLMDRIQELLRYAFQTENRLTLAVPGTGTAAMEAAVANMVEPGDKVLVCINGYFSNRIADMARRYGGEVQTIQRPWGDVFRAAEVDEALKAFPAKLVAIVHAETSTGAWQPLEDIIKIVHAHGATIIVDAVTSLGGLPVTVDASDIDVCYSGAQKCLGSPPGASPITLGPRAVEALQKRRTPPTNWYLDLNLLGKYWGPERVYHHTGRSAAPGGLGRPGSALGTPPPQCRDALARLTRPRPDLPRTARTPPAHADHSAHA